MNNNFYGIIRRNAAAIFSENKRPRMELPFNGGQPASSTSTVTSTNGVLVHRNGFPSHQPAAEFSSKCPICLWPLFSPR